MNWSDFPRESLGFYLEKAGAAAIGYVFTTLRICVYVLESDPKKITFMSYVIVILHP